MRTHLALGALLLPCIQAAVKPTQRYRQGFDLQVQGSPYPGTPLADLVQNELNYTTNGNRITIVNLDAEAVEDLLPNTPPNVLAAVATDITKTTTRVDISKTKALQSFDLTSFYFACIENVGLPALVPVPCSVAFSGFTPSGFERIETQTSTSGANMTKTAFSTTRYTGITRFRIYLTGAVEQVENLALLIDTISYTANRKV